MPSSELSKLICDPSNGEFTHVPFRDYFTNHSAGKGERDINDTSIAEQFCWNIMADLADSKQSKTYGHTELKQLFENGYYHPAFFGKEESPSINVLTEKATYVLPRLVKKEDIGLLADAEIHFTDNAADFYSGATEQNIRTADKRSRNYRVDKDKEDRTHITYLLKHSVEDNYIDAFELVKYLSFVEFYKDRIKNSVFDIKGEAGIKLDKDLKALGFSFEEYSNKKASRNPKYYEEFKKKSIYIWATSGESMTLTRSQNFSLLPPWQTYDYKSANLDEDSLTRDQDTVLDAVRTIKREAESKGFKIPEHLIYGNDFSIPLLLTLGLFDQQQIDRIYQLAPANVREELKAEIINVWGEENKDII